MNTLMLHTEDKPVTVKVDAFTNREGGEPDFWTVEVRTEDLEVEFFFHSLGAIEHLYDDLGEAIAKLHAETAPAETPETPETPLEVA